MFRKAAFVVAGVTSAIVSRALAQTVQQDWTFPINPNESSNVTIGNTYPVSWTSDLQNWFGQYCSNCNTSNLDLWVTGADSAQYQYKVATQIDVVNSDSFSWTVNVPASDLTTETTWVLRFVPADSASPSATNGQQISSPLFYINAPASASASSTQTSTAISTTSATTASQQSSTSTSSPVATASSSSSTTSALSTDASIGIGVGVGLGVLLLIALVFVYCCSRARRRRRHGGASLTAALPQHEHEWAPVQAAAAHAYDGGNGGSWFRTEKTGGYGPSEASGEAAGQGGDGGGAVWVMQDGKTSGAVAAHELGAEREPGELPAWGNEPWRSERAELEGREMRS